MDDVREEDLKTWRRTVEEEIGRVRETWKEVRALAQNRIRWRYFAGDLFSRKIARKQVISKSSQGRMIFF
jgi:hypothetical protein